MALLFIVGLALAVSGKYFLAFLCIIGIWLISSHIKKHEKYYERKLDEDFDDDTFK